MKIIEYDMSEVFCVFPYEDKKYVIVYLSKKISFTWLHENRKWISINESLFYDDEKHPFILEIGDYDENFVFLTDENYLFVNPKNPHLFKYYNGVEYTMTHCNTRTKTSFSNPMYDYSSSGKLLPIYPSRMI